MEALGCKDLDEGIAHLLARGVGAVLTSLGAEGMRLKTPNICTAWLSVNSLQENPTGAGTPLSPLSRCAAATPPIPSAVGFWLPSGESRRVVSPLLSPVAGEIDDEIAQQLLPEYKSLRKAWKPAPLEN